MGNSAGKDKDIAWNESTKKQFDFLISKIPLVLRSTAKRMITPKAESIVKEDGRSEVSEKDMVDEIYTKVPESFHVAMKNDMKECNIDWTKYGYPK